MDFEGVKNAVGAFYPPQAVLIDPDTLATLDRRELRAGLAEAVKMAVTLDREEFERIERCPDALEEPLPLIRAALLNKRRVVEEDPAERGLRGVLNFGHTIGQALESAERGRLLHGECVAAGMIPMCSEKVRGRLESVLARNGLPVRIR